MLLKIQSILRNAQKAIKAVLMNMLINTDIYDVLIDYLLCIQKHQKLTKLAILISHMENDREIEELRQKLEEANLQLSKYIAKQTEAYQVDLEEEHASHSGEIKTRALASNQFSMEEQQTEKTSFFDQLPNEDCSLDYQSKFLDFKANYVSTKKKDDLFRRNRKQQERSIMARKEEILNKQNYSFEIPRRWKGSFTLKNQSTGKLQITSLNHDDLDKLKPQADLNDSVIDAYLKIIQIYKMENGQSYAHFFSSFFLEKLIGDHLKEQQNLEKEQDKFIQNVKQTVQSNYKNITRWTKKIDLFTKKYIVIPINAFRHWWCLIVSNPAGRLTLGGTTEIIYCDSMSDKRNFIIGAVRKYFQLQLKQRKGVEVKINDTNMPCYQLLLPRQTNTHDCGLYMMAYIEHLLINPKEMENLSQVQNRNKLKLFPRCIIYCLRGLLFQLFLDISKEQSEILEEPFKYDSSITKFLNAIKKIEDEAVQADFDQLNQKEFKKYQQISSSMEQSLDPQKQYETLIQFYMDLEVNFYQKDTNIIF